MSLPLKSFYFMRHGETDWNRRHIIMGQHDIPLNQNGLEQAERAALTLKNEPITRIITSPLLRALKTAEIVAETLGVPVTMSDDLKECGWGAQEKKPVHDDILTQWLEGVTHEGAEPASLFEKRVMRGLTQVLEETESSLIVAHGGVYAALQRVMGWPFVNLGNCAILHHRPSHYPDHSWFVGFVSVDDDAERLS